MERRDAESWWRGPGDLPEPPPGLQRAWARELANSFALYNDWYLSRSLDLPQFRIGFGSERLGAWDGFSRTITIAAEHILRHPWARVLETLRHEMAHQYAEEVLGAHEGPSHGPAFREACRLLRIEPEPSAPEGALGRIEESSAKRDQILSRIKLLLALAKSPNEHEAANAMRMANRYLLEYNLSLADADAPRRYAARQLGKCSARVQEYEYALAELLQRYFFVRTLWAFSYDPLRNLRGHILEIYGTPENVTMAEHAYNFLRDVGERLWEERRASGAAIAGTKFQYLAGLMAGFSEKLRRERDQLAEEKGLVWRGDASLEEYFHHVNPRLRSIGVRGVSRSEFFQAGKRDGRRITIHRPLGGDSRGGRPAGALPGAAAPEGRAPA